MATFLIRSKEAIKLAVDTFGEGVEAFFQAEEAAVDFRISQTELSSRRGKSFQPWQIEAKANGIAEKIDPRHRANKIKMAHCLSAADLVVDGLVTRADTHFPMILKTSEQLLSMNPIMRGRKTT